MSLDLDSPQSNRDSIGSWALGGGAIAGMIGMLLLIFGPSPTLGLSPLNPHQMAFMFLVLGAVLVLIGAVARLLFRR